MRRDRLARLTERLRHVSDEEFTMTLYGCGTVACIAGHGAVEALADRLGSPVHVSEAVRFQHDIFDRSDIVAKEWLEIDENLGNILFYPPRNWKTISREMAIQALVKLWNGATSIELWSHVPRS